MDSNFIFAQVVPFMCMLVVAIGVHEWAHVAMAYWLGDDTGKRMGRLTLNPIVHADPLWTLGLPLLLLLGSAGAGGLPFFAAGKPAPYNPLKLTREFRGKRITMRNGEILVAAAGPVSNFALALLTILVVRMSVQSLSLFTVSSQAFSLCFSFFTLNIALLVFNLIPIPPLDGSKVVANLLPGAKREAYLNSIGRYSMVLFALLIFGGARYIMGPIMNGASLGFASLVLS